jgi:N-acetylmuramoyl-L-alanine amidase
MARFSARGLLLLLGLLTACTAPAQPRPAPPAPAKAEPVRAAPLPGDRPGQTPAGQQAGTARRPVQVWPFTKFRGVDYVAVRDLAKRYGLKAAWTKPGVLLTLSDARGVRFTFERDQRDFYLDGARIFLGELTYLSGNDLWVPKLDVIKTIAPLFAPADHTSFLPPAPRLIVLDPGHGGTDPGKQNLKLKIDEKDMTLDVALRLKKILEVRGYKVVLTRTTDTRFSNSQAVDLPVRADFANKAGADLFISLHFNAVDRDPERVSGVETYVLTPQFQVSTQPEQDREMVKTYYPGNRQDTANALLGYHLHRQLVTDLKASDRGYKRYRYAVLRTLASPGVLVEAAYLSNDAEARRVAKPEFRQQIAEAVAEGVGNYAATLAALRPAPEAGNK